MIELDSTLEKERLDTARGIADWICNLQSPWLSTSAAPGVIPFSVTETGSNFPAPSWTYAFTSMGMASAYETFKDEKYKIASQRFIKVLSSFQIFDPFNENHYGVLKNATDLKKLTEMAIDFGLRDLCKEIYS